ncbi:MAG: FAD-dependent oxidoreductase [Calditrichaeota bacterium]|nr:FAD-dependent oxidoreductase [Calditrichota bacterium]
MIGAGSGGIGAANPALGLGKKVALVEKKRIDGDYTWYGCVPSKALIKASEVAHKIKSAARYGLRLDDSYLSYLWRYAQATFCESFCGKNAK